MDTPLKQRLIGAIVLVALAVIFLPMLVKGPAPDSGVASVPIAAPDAPADGQFETRELPLVAPAGEPPACRPGRPSRCRRRPRRRRPWTRLRRLPPATAVTFGAYGKADADAVIAYLQRSQLPGFAETTTISGRQAWRVRVGPYADRAQAEAARLQAVKIRADVKAEVITLDAAASSGAAVAAAAPTTSTRPRPRRRPPATGARESLPPSTPTATQTRAAQAGTEARARKPDAKPEPKPEAAANKPAPATPTAPAASGVGFAVQLGAFARPTMPTRCATGPRRRLQCFRRAGTH